MNFLPTKIFTVLQRISRLSQQMYHFHLLYLLLRTPIIIPILVKNEGIKGAFTWLYYRLKFTIKNKHLSGNPQLTEQPINTFNSRHGFTLSHLIEYITYDEIFLDGCYEFTSLRKLLNRQQHTENISLDIGTNHVMFINFLHTLQPQIRCFGAELSPTTYAKANKRFKKEETVTLTNVGIGGYSRNSSITLSYLSPTQSIYSKDGEQTADAKIITTNEFAKMHNINKKQIVLIKMDIEGAEKEVFENFETIKDVLIMTNLFIIEIHSPDYIKLITSKLNSIDFSLQEKIGLNYFFAKSLTKNT